MATCDPDGRIAQALSDRLTCLAMDMREALAASLLEVQRVLDQAPHDS